MELILKETNIYKIAQFISEMYLNVNKIEFNEKEIIIYYNKDNHKLRTLNNYENKI